MLRRFLAVVMLVSSVGVMVADSTDTYRKYIPEVHATLRARYELDTELGDARFQVRNARVNLNGYVTDFLSYYLRADFCDRGKFSVLDAFATLRASSRLKVMMGQMRVPLSVDASRAVNQYWFVNRAFPGKDMWSSRKVGVKARYHFNIRKLPAYVEGGVFSSASTVTQDTWSKNYTFGIIGVVTLGDFMPEIGFQSNEVSDVRVNNWNASLTWHRGMWEAEGEMLYKHYTHHAAESVKAYNFMARRFFPIRSRWANRVSLDLRFDGMTDNCDGKTNDAGALVVTKTARKRLTVGSTLAYIKLPVKAHLRLNYEQYFHGSSRVKTPADDNKLSLELMLHF